GLWVYVAAARWRVLVAAACGVDDLLRPPQHVRVLIENPRPRCQDLFPRLTEWEHQPQLVEQLRPLREVVQQVLGFLERVPFREQVHVVEGCDPVPRPTTRRLL